jgi:hypothetical protein
MERTAHRRGRRGLNLLDVFRGEVVWFGRYVGSGKKVKRQR